MAPRPEAPKIEGAPCTVPLNCTEAMQALWHADNHSGRGEPMRVHLKAALSLLAAITGAFALATAASAGSSSFTINHVWCGDWDRQPRQCVGHWPDSDADARRIARTFRLGHL